MPEEPCPRVKDDGLAEIVKSCGGVTDTVTITECEREPLVPVILTMYEPKLALPVEMLRVEVPLPLADMFRKVGLRPAEGPEGATVSDKLTVPEKLLRLVRLTVDVPDEPWTRLMEEGFADMAKSGVGGCVTLTDTLVECDREPLVPVKVTV